MNEKQQQLTFEKGITNVPSDPICSDNALEYEEGMIYYDGEHHVIQHPAVIEQINENYKLIFVHRVNGETRYILHGLIDNYLYFALVGVNVEFNPTKPKLYSSQSSDDAIIPVTDNTQITAIGKTLIVTTESGIKYLVANESNYKCFDSIPIPDVEFFMYDPVDSDTANNVDKDTLQCVRCEKLDLDIEQTKTDDFATMIVGLYEKNKNEICKKKGFCLPFFVRTAVEMYDGSYTHISAPILLMPSLTSNSYCSEAEFENSGKYFSYLSKMELTTRYRKLYYINKSDLTGFEDLVNNITVFISRPIDIYDTTGDQVYDLLPHGQSKEVLRHDGIYSISAFPQSIKRAYKYTERYPSESFPTASNHVLPNLKKKEISTIKRELESCSVFYKLGEIELKGNNVPKDASQIFSETTLENITTQQQLKHDDYFSMCPMVADLSYVYNSRLNLARIKRGFFEGFHNFMGYDYQGLNTENIIYVRIKTDSGYRYVRHVSPSTSQRPDVWFYYPDPRADHVSIYRNNSCILDVDLKEHHGLHGAYYFRAYPTELNDNEAFSGTIANSILQKQAPEVLFNQIATSEVNNPFVFHAEGYNSIGSGEVMAFSTQTQALSQGQFGQYPLLVFSTDGIWAMSVSNTGIYSAIHPMSREVCSNPKSITQTDGAVFFVSKKGLMCVVGSQVTCVSQQLNGKTSDMLGFGTDEANGIGSFSDFIQDTQIAYDYRDSLLWLFDNKIPRALVYSIKSGTFSMAIMSNKVLSVVNDYPDMLIQLSQFEIDDNDLEALVKYYGEPGSLLSFMERPNPNNDGDFSYNARLVTRPMKFENGLALKSIIQIKHINNFMHKIKTYRKVGQELQLVEDIGFGKIALRIFASNNLTHWVELKSLRGTPWKYYKFDYTFDFLAATDTFAGSVIITQERRTNKLR